MPSPIPFHILINRNGQTVLTEGEEKVVETLRAIFGARAAAIDLLTGAEIGPAVSRLSQQYNDASRILLICGGDGTVQTAAGHMMKQKDIPLAVLHLGTFGGFAKSLGFTGDYRKDAATLRDAAEPRLVDVGDLNGVPFFFGGLLDPISKKFFDTRETLRAKSVLGLLKTTATLASQITFGKDTELRVSTGADTPGAYMSAKIVTLTKNALKPLSSEHLSLPRDGRAFGWNTLRPAAPDDGMVGLYALNNGFGVADAKNLFDAFKAGTWTQHHLVISKVAPELHISHADPATPAETQINLDGESRTVTFPLHVRNLPRALNIYTLR
jgi:diacylglycerol kinase family enzyme